MGSDDHLKTPYFMINKTALDDGVAKLKSALNEA